MMTIPIGTVCRIVRAEVAKNHGAIVIVVGDAGKRHINGLGVTQCYYLDRDIETSAGKRRNWGSEKQLEPIDKQPMQHKPRSVEVVA